MRSRLLPRVSRTGEPSNKENRVAHLGKYIPVNLEGFPFSITMPRVIDLGQLAVRRRYVPNSVVNSQRHDMSDVDRHFTKISNQKRECKA